MKVISFFSIFLFLFCVFIPFVESSEISLGGGPDLRWKEWTVGQSSGSGRIINLSFITNSETTNCIDISVGYSDDQPDHFDFVYPLNYFEFELSMSHGFTLTKYEYERTGPDASLFDTKTRFRVKAHFSGNPDTETLQTCNGLNGRNNEPIEVSVKFIGYYGTDPNKIEKVELVDTWTQDAIDRIRQEYVDMTPPGNKAELPVPPRESFVPTITTVDQDRWNTGHDSTLMIDDGLIGKRGDWLTEVNVRREQESEKRVAEGLSALLDFTTANMRVTSGYRNPYHNRFHVGVPFIVGICMGMR